MRNKLLLFFLISLHLNLSYSQDGPTQSTQPDSTLFVSEEALISLPITNSRINFSISSSGKNAIEANSGLLSVKNKIESLTGSKLVVANRSFSGGSGAGGGLSSGSSILITEDITSNVNEEALPRILDSLLPIPLLKISEVSPLKDNLSSLKTLESSKVVTLALQKAAQIAKDQLLTLGDIIDVTITEEPSVASIREQLGTNGNSILSSPTEIKIVASLKIRLKKK